MISLDSIINSLEETAMLFNKKAKVIYVNKTGEEFFSKSSRDIPGKIFTSIVGSRRFISPLIRTAIKEGWSCRARAVDLNIGPVTNIDFNLSLFYTSKKQRAGIGLSIFRKIIKDLRGFIMVKIWENQGGCFYLYPSCARNG